MNHVEPDTYVYMLPTKLWPVSENPFNQRTDDEETPVSTVRTVSTVGESPVNDRVADPVEIRKAPEFPVGPVGPVFPVFPVGPVMGPVGPVFPV